MTAEAYVNVVALMGGARGRDDGCDFDANHVVSHIPPAMGTVPVSRTILTSRDRWERFGSGNSTP